MTDKINVTEMLEQMIDQDGLLHVLTGLELICGERADHFRAIWQDNTSAKLWDRSSKIVGAAARKIPDGFDLTNRT